MFTKQDSALGKAIDGVKASLWPVVLFSCCINLLMLVSPLYMLQVYDRVLISGSQPTLLFLTLFALTALTLLMALDGLRSLLLSRVGAKFEKQVAGPTFKHIVEHGGHSQPLRDVENLRTFMSSPALAALMDAPWTPLYLGLIYLLHPLLGHLALGGAIVLFFLALLGERLTRIAQKEAGISSGQANLYTDICGRQQSAIYAMGMADNLKQRWAKPSHRALAYSSLATQYGAYISSISKGLRFALQVGVLGLGAWLAIQQVTTPGVMIAASIIMGRGLAPIEACISGWRLVISARDARQRLTQFFGAMGEQQEPLDLPAPAGHLNVAQAVFGFDADKPPLLNDITFELTAGTVLGISGPNAAGKSTLGKLLIGLYQPRFGSVRLDGATFDQWDRRQLGPHIGYLPQEVELFPGSIADNISRFAEADSEAIVEAAKLAECHEMILGLPGGYNCSAGDFGEVLSGGQRQRIALARAVFGKPSLVLLDEPTSSLDAEAERSVMRSIVGLKQRGTTVIVIGHRPALMNVTDQLLVLQQGRIALMGDTPSVMAKVTRQVANANGAGA